MVKKIFDVLGNCLSFPFKRRSWTSERWIIEWIKKSLILLWIVYFIVQSIIRDGSKSDGIFTNFMIVITEYVKKLPFINHFSSIRPVEVLLGMTIFGSFVLVVLWIFKKYWNYKGLPPKKFPEYDFDFQKKLVTFLNEKPQFGHNIYWLDGSWGSGKTHFLRTFFQKQSIKKLEIYYVSCFGIKSRDQAEQVLIREIEERSSLGSLDHIPVISSLVKWGFKTLGLDLMKEDSVVIFDDLERVSYNVKAQDTQSNNATKKINGESKDKGNDDPKDYNDLLGFIDYLANHKNQKVIVVYSSTDMEQTAENIIKKKFSPIENKMLSVDEVIDKIIEKDGDLTTFTHQFLALIYKIKINGNSGENLRNLVSDVNSYRNVDSSWEELEKFVIENFNAIRDILKGIKIFNQELNPLDPFLLAAYIERDTKTWEKKYCLYVELVKLLRQHLEVYPKLRELTFTAEEGFSLEREKNNSLLVQGVLDELLCDNRVGIDLFRTETVQITNGDVDSLEEKLVNVNSYYKLENNILEEIISQTSSDNFNEQFVRLLYEREYTVVPPGLGNLEEIVELMLENKSNHKKFISNITIFIKDFDECLSDVKDEKSSPFLFKVDDKKVSDKLFKELSDTIPANELQSLSDSQDNKFDDILVKRLAYYQHNLKIYEKLLILMWQEGFDSEVTYLMEDTYGNINKEYYEKNEIIMAFKLKVAKYFENQSKHIL